MRWRNPCRFSQVLKKSRNEAVLRSRAVRELTSDIRRKARQPRDFAIQRAVSRLPVFDGLRGEIFESLRRFFEIFPFSGDGDRRPGLIYTAWPSLQCHSPYSSAMAAGKLGMTRRHCPPDVTAANSLGLYRVACSPQLRKCDQSGNAADPDLSPQLLPKRKIADVASGERNASRSVWRTAFGCRQS
jgi:hypothetical protein